MDQKTISILLIAFGLVYLVKPDIYRRWFWKKTDVSQKIFSPENYLVFMRVLGGIFVAAGIVLLLLNK